MAATKRHHCHDLIPSNCHAKIKTSRKTAFIRAKQAKRNSTIVQNTTTLHCSAKSFFSFFLALHQL